MNKLRITVKEIKGTCFVNLFINYSIRLGYGVVLPEMIQALGFSRAAGGSIYNAYFLSYVSLTPFAGYLTDRLGARRVITVCAGILGGGVLLMGSVGSFWAVSDKGVRFRVSGFIVC